MTAARHGSPVPDEGHAGENAGLPGQISTPEILRRQGVVQIFDGIEQR